MAVIEQEMVATEANRPSQISWGAVLAGLVFVFAVSWLMFLLGSAIGVGIADATDMEAIGDGLSIGAIIWMLLTSIIAFFLGGLLAGRLAGNPDKTVGMLHGVTLWSVGTVLGIVLAYLGVSTLLQTGQAVVQTAANITMTAGSTVASGAQAAGANLSDTISNFASSSLGARIQARLKKRATEMVAEASPQVTQQEVEQAISEIDSQTLVTAATQIIAGNTDAAKQALTEQTSLSEQEINNIVDGVTEEFKQSLQNQTDNPNLFTDLEDQLKSRTSAAIVSLADSQSAQTPESAQVSPQEITQAIEQLDGQTLQNTAWYVFQGDMEGAKDTLAANTNLSEEEINTLVDGVSEEINTQIEEYKAEISQQIETVSDYTQAVLWIIFISSAFGLVLAIVGGWLGSETVERVYLIAARRETVV